MARLAALRVLGAALRLRPTRRPLAGAPRRILLIRPDHLGDVLFTTPAVARLRADLPAAEIWYLCGPWSSPLLASNPNLDRVITCDFPWFNRRPRGPLWAPYLTLWREARRLGALGFDNAVILRFDFWWGAALAALAGIPHRVGYDTAECLPLLTDSVHYTPGRHEVLQNITLGRHLLPGADPAGGEQAPATRGADDGDASRWTRELALEFHPSAAEGDHAAVLLADLEQRQGPLIAIHPGAGAAVKLWPAERWAALADVLVRRWNADIILTGSAAERPLIHAIAQHMRRSALDLSGQTGLGELAAVLGCCDLVLGVDSGPMHLAVAMATPTVHLYGPVSAVAFGPWGDPATHVVVQASFADEPCHGRPCNRLDFGGKELAEHHCMATITLEAALAAAEGLLSRREEGSRAGCPEGAAARPGK